MMFEQELKTYHKNLKKLRELYPLGGFVVIYGDEILDVWLDSFDALKEGLKAYGTDVKFMIKDINEKPLVVHDIRIVTSNDKTEGIKPIMENKENTQEKNVDNLLYESKCLSEKLINFYFNESDKILRDYVRVESVLTERGYILLGIYLALLTTVIGYVLSTINLKTNLAETSGSMSIIVFMTISIYYIFKVIKPHQYCSPGKEPKGFVIPTYFKYFEKIKLEEEYQYKYVQYCELKNLQSKISRQRILNIKRAKYTTNSIRFMIFGVFVAVLMYVTAYILESYHFQ